MTGTTVATLAERALRRLGVAVVPLADRPDLSATVTVADLATRALVQLAVIASDETPSATDQALAVSKVSAVHDSLVTQAVVWWPSTAIPNPVSEDYVMLAALHLATAFGKQGDPAQQPVLEGRVHAMALVLSAQDHAVEAVNAVHVNLAARGLVRWTVFDIPPAAELPYVMLAANDLAPLFGKPLSQPDEVGARRALAQIIALPTSGASVVAAYF